MRKFYSFSLLMLLSMTLCGIVAVAQSVTVGNIEYFIQNDGTATITSGDSARDNVIIPTGVKYNGRIYIVDEIAPQAFMHNNAITSIKIPTSVKWIGGSAFYRCENLTFVNGGAETLDYIGQEPFDHTPWLAKLPAVDGLKYWKGWIIGTDLSGRFDDLYVRDGTVGIVYVYGTGKLSGKNIYLPKQFRTIEHDYFEVEKFYIDKENPTFFSDDYGNVYHKNYHDRYYSVAEDKEVELKGQMLWAVPTASHDDTLKVAEGTISIPGVVWGINHESIIVPEGCEKVPGCFSYLKRCKYIELPSTLKSFDMYNPEGDSLLKVVLKAKEVPDPPSYFPFIGCSHVTLYVPKESLEKYLADSRYKGKFKEIKAIPDDAPLKGDINGDGKVNAADVTTVYNYIANPEATGLTLDKVDINGDGKVNTTDITDLYNIIHMK